ncbi:MAG: DUF423 domain-containing protein [Nannocystaceae bacterium]|nr:DUF423 domain-containing protein [Nannocystaceae bacterium]
MRRTLAVAAGLGLVGVAAGAFGAHGLRDLVSARDLSTWETAARYQQIHAVLLAAIALWGPSSKAIRAAAVLLGVGVVIFSGTLYAIVLGGPRILGAVTPLGGLCLMAAWGALLVHALAMKKS